MAGLLVLGLTIWAWPRQAAAPAMQTRPFAASLAGTAVDGPAPQAEAGLRIDDDLRRLFDYYLATEGEQSLAAIEAAIDAELDRRYGAAPARQAKALFRRYLAYKRALVQLDADTSLQGAELGTARRRLDAARALRGRFFSAAEAQALFGWEDRYDDDALARMQIQRDSSLDAPTRSRKLAELDAQLDPAMLAQRQAPLRQLALAEQVAAARQRGADADEVFRLRAANVGEAAAQRLAALDQDNARWQARIESYRGARAAIVADTTRDATAREQALAQLREAGFNAQERLRLAAYE